MTTQQHDLHKARRTRLRIQKQHNRHVELLCYLAELEHIYNRGPEEISSLMAMGKARELENRKAEMYLCFKDLMEAHKLEKLIRRDMRQDWMG